VQTPIEIHSWVIIAWTLLTAFASAGSAFGAIKWQQRTMRETIVNLSESLQKTKDRLHHDEFSYRQTKDCESIRTDCIERTKQVLGEIKELIHNMDCKRETARKEHEAALRELRDEVIALKTIASRNGKL
jgi:hypothetical protein